MGKLDGKVALISGGARGQGAAEVELFTQEGAKVVFGDVRDEEGKRVEAELRELGRDALYVHLDVRDGLNKSVDCSSTHRTLSRADGLFRVSLVLAQS